MRRSVSAAARAGFQIGFDELMDRFDKKLAALETRLRLAERRLDSLRALVGNGPSPELSRTRAKTIATAERTAQLVRRSLELARAYRARDAKRNSGVDAESVGSGRKQRA